tara:strand:- start:12 stop:221 length:210 start_codon:yes stop_codon:yes gene_type:complete
VKNFRNFFKNSATIITVLLIASVYVGVKLIFEDGIEMGEIIITLLVLLYLVWGFDLQFWKHKRKIDREE